MLEKPDREECVTRQELREELRWMMDGQRPGARCGLGPDFWAIVTVGVVLAGLLLSQVGSLRSELNDQLRTIREDMKDLPRTPRESTAE